MSKRRSLALRSGSTLNLSSGQLVCVSQMIRMMGNDLRPCPRASLSADPCLTEPVHIVVHTDPAALHMRPATSPGLPPFHCQEPALTPSALG